MRDQIIDGYVKDFTEDQSLTGLSESEVFERFVNYCVVSKHHPEAFDVEAVCVAGGGDLGIDGLAILVNDHLVTSIEEVDYFKKMLRRLDVKFIFVQAKGSPHFDGHEITAFVQGVRRFFDQSLPREANQSITNLHTLKQYLYDASIHMDASPTCLLYYVCTGKWTSDNSLAPTADKGLEDLRNTNLFSTVTFNPIDAEALKRLYRNLRQKITREIVFDSCIL